MLAMSSHIILPLKFDSSRLLFKQKINFTFLISCSCDKSLSHFIHRDSKKCTSWKFEAMSVITLVVWRQQNKLKCVWQVFLNLLDEILPENVKITKQKNYASCCFFPKFRHSISAKPIAFQQNLPQKFLQNWLLLLTIYFFVLFKFAIEILRKFLWNLPFFPKFVYENPTKFEFSVHNLSEALI